MEINRTEPFPFSKDSLPRPTDENHLLVANKTEKECCEHHVCALGWVEFGIQT